MFIYTNYTPLIFKLLLSNIFKRLLFFRKLLKNFNKFLLPLLKTIILVNNSSVQFY